MLQKTLDNVIVELDGIPIPNVQAVRVYADRRGNAGATVTVPPNPLWLRYDVQSILKGGLVHLYVEWDGEWYLMFEGILKGFQPIIDAAGHWQTQLVIDHPLSLLRRVNLVSLTIDNNIFEAGYIAQSAGNVAYPSVAPITLEFKLSGAAQNMHYFVRRLLHWHNDHGLHEAMVAAEEAYLPQLEKTLKAKDASETAKILAVSEAVAAVAATVGKRYNLARKIGYLRWIFGRLKALNLYAKTFIHENPIAKQIFTMERFINFLNGVVGGMNAGATFFDILLRYVAMGFYDLAYTIFPPKNENGDPVLYQIIPHPMVTPPPITNVYHHRIDFDALPIQSLVGDEATRIALLHRPILQLLVGSLPQTGVTTQLYNRIISATIKPGVDPNTLAKGGDDTGAIDPTLWRSMLFVEEFMNGPVIVSATENPILSYAMQSVGNSIIAKAQKAPELQNQKQFTVALDDEDRKIQRLSDSFAYFLFYQQRYGRNTLRLQTRGNPYFLMPYPSLIIAPENQAYYGVPLSVVYSLTAGGQFDIAIDFTEVRHKYAPIPAAVLKTLPSDMLSPKATERFYQKLNTHSAGEVLNTPQNPLQYYRDSTSATNLNGFHIALAERADESFDPSMRARSFFTMEAYKAYLKERMPNAFRPLRQALTRLLAQAIKEGTTL